MKIMRTYIQGVLQYGIPPKFYMGLIKVSTSRGSDKKILDKMLKVFAEADLIGQYGAKEDALDEDYFPYVCNELTSPSFI